MGVSVGALEWGGMAFVLELGETGNDEGQCLGTEKCGWDVVNVAAYRNGVGWGQCWGVKDYGGMGVSDGAQRNGM